MAEINDSNDFNFGIPLPPPVVRSHRADTRKIPMTYIPYIPTAPTHAGPSLLRQRGLWGFGNGNGGSPAPISPRIVHRTTQKTYVPAMTTSSIKIGPSFLRQQMLYGFDEFDGASTYNKYAVYMASGVLVAGVVAAILLLKR